MAALNAARAPLAPMVAEVLWLSAPTAFTLPGSYIYITRRLIERCTSDAPVAFALAHEIAHHDLGHLKRGERWMDTRLADIFVGLALIGIERLELVIENHLDLEGRRHLCIINAEFQARSG